jgi:DNA-binding NarL/FixJ family response regulator
MSIRILLCDDHQIMRESLRTLIAREKDLTVVGEAGDGDEALRLARTQKPDVIIMDVGLPGANGIAATRQIRSVLPQARILALSMHMDKRFVQGMLTAGASGYRVKDCAFAELAKAVRTAMRGDVYLCPRIADVLHDLPGARRPPPAGATDGALTPKEREILLLIAGGHSTKDIAGELDVSVKTIETHRQHLMEKLGLHTVAALTKYAVREGLTPMDT